MSPVKILLIRIMMRSNAHCGCVGTTGGRLSELVVDLMCCHGWAMWPWMVASVLGQYLATRAYTRLGQEW